MTIGQRIAAWRNSRGMSQRSLAKKVGVTQGAVAQWEDDSPKGTSPSQDNLEKTVTALRLTMAQFYGPIPKPKRKAS